MTSCTDLNFNSYQDLCLFSAVDPVLGISRGRFPDMDPEMIDMSFIFSTLQEQCYQDELSSCSSDKDVSSCGSDDCFSVADNALTIKVREIINNDRGHPPPSYEQSINQFFKPAVTLTPATPTTVNNTLITTNQSKVQDVSSHSNTPVCPIKNVNGVKIKQENLSSEIESTDERKGRPPRNCSSVYSAANFETKPAKKIHKPRVKKTIHLWEFLEEIVDNTAYSPKYITWMDRDEGVFRLVDSKAVARLWGQRKNRHDMTYEKMSRAIRYYYERGIIRHVMGQKLIYQFGEEINEKRREKLTKSPTTIDSKPCEPCTA